MKRFLSLMILLCILISGCSIISEQHGDQIVFYYLQKEYQYGHSNGVIVPEAREINGSRRDLPYLMALYLMGPADEAYRVPLPSGTRIYCENISGDMLNLELSEAARVLTDSEYTIACTCLAMTCFEITDAEKVTIVNGERSMVLSRNSYIFSDDPSASQITEETK